MKALFLLASARSHGNSEQLARRAASGLADKIDQDWIALREFPLDAFEDRRHASAYEEPTGNAKLLVESTLAADHIVFVTPVYWYSVPAPLKLYLDYWSHWMRVERLDFKAKMAGKSLRVIAASAGPIEQAAPMMQSLELCAKYLSMTWGGFALGNGSAPGDVMSDAVAVELAEKLVHAMGSDA